MGFLINTFSGMKPRMSPRLVGAQHGQKIVNALFISGELDALKTDRAIGTTATLPTGTIKSLYKFGDHADEDKYWFTWGVDVDVVRGAIDGDTTQRTYFTGFGYPKMTYFPVAITGGTTNYPVISYQLGIPVPDSEISITRVKPQITSITFSGTTATATTAVAHNRAFGDTVDISGASESPFNGVQTITSTPTATTFTYEMDSSPSANATGTIYYNLGGGNQSIIYGITYVSGSGEEGKPLITDIITYAEGDTIQLAQLPVAPAGNYNITKKRLYRSVSGSSEASLLFVAEIPLGQTTYDDSALSSQLGETIPSLFYDAPPDDMFGLTEFLHGTMAGISGNQVLLCEPYQPHAYPVANRYSFSYPPIALGAFGNSIVVLSKGKPELLTGSDSQNMSQDIIQFGRPCVSAQSVVELEGGVAWACDDGIAFMSSNGFSLLTDACFTKREWANYQPKTIRAYQWQGKYIGFYGGVAGFIYDLASGEFREIDFYATAAYTDPETGGLYFVGKVDNSLNQLYLLDDGDDYRTIHYKSKVFVENWPRTMRLARVLADEYPVSFKLYGDGVLRYDTQVQNSDIFSLPMGYQATSYEVELTATAKLTSVTVAESIEVFKAVSE